MKTLWRVHREDKSTRSSSPKAARSGLFSVSFLWIVPGTRLPHTPELRWKASAFSHMASSTLPSVSGFAVCVLSWAGQPETNKQQRQNKQDLRGRNIRHIAVVAVVPGPRIPRQLYNGTVYLLYFKPSSSRIHNRIQNKMATSSCLFLSVSHQCVCLPFFLSQHNRMS